MQNAAMCSNSQCPCLAIREVVSWDIIKDCHCHHVVIIKCHRSNIKLDHFVIVHIMIARTICDLSSVSQWLDCFKSGEKSTCTKMDKVEKIYKR